MRACYFFHVIATVLLTVILTVAFVGSASAKTIRVNLSGEGDYSSIQEAVNAAKEGDIIMVDPGTYRESVVIEKRITLIGSGPEATAIYATTGNAVTFKWGSGAASIIGFSITSAGENGIYCESQTSPGISNNVISGGKNGVYCEYSQAGISNNVIIGSGSNGVYIYGSHSQPEDSPTVVNNIIIGNGGYGIYYTGTSLPASYNDFWNNAQQKYGCEWKKPEGISVGPGNIEQDPLFVNPGVDFHLREGSPCIDAGKPGFASLDPDGTRNDMGAYGGPYATVSGLLGPVITNLEVTPSSVEQGGTITIKATGSVR